MEIFIVLIGIILITTFVSGIISIRYAWLNAIAKGDASGFMGDVFSNIWGNWIAVIGILVLCLPVWLILSMVVNAKNRRRHGGGTSIFQATNRYEEGTNQSGASTRRFDGNQTSAGRATQRIARPQKITIGRNRYCDIKVDDQYQDVSRNHATITKGESLVFEDNSSFGSFVNGQKVHHAQAPINQNDHIRLGYKYLLSWNEISKHFYK